MRHIYLNGSTIGRVDNDDSGVNIELSGWDSTMREIEIGDILAIHSRSSNMYSTYIVTDVNYPNNVKDQFFIGMRWISKSELENLHNTPT